MAKRVSPYHSIDGDVYHVYSDCVVGNNIEHDKKRAGTDNKRKCKNCADIEAGNRTR